MSNDFVSCDNSDKSSEVNSNDFASSDSSVKSSEPKSNDSTSCASTSSISTSESEAEFESNVGTPIQETINVQDLPSFSCNSSDKNGNTSRTSCNKNGYFNKKAGHFRKNASSVTKLCFVCGSSTHLIKDCDFYETQMANKTVGNGVGPVHSRNNVNHQNQFVPQAVLLRTGKVNITPARPQSVPTGKPKVPAPVPTGRQNRPIPVPTGRGDSPSVTSGWVRWATAVKPSAGCSWKTHRKGLYWENSYTDAEDEGIFDSGCSRSMTGNMERLDDFQEFQGGKVTFGGGEGRITGKGTIRTPTLDFENVYYVKELQQFNLFSISQICDKKNRVLFTDTDCLVLSKDFKLPDESMVLLRVPRKHNLYTINLNNLSPKGNLACLVAKASVDESVKWHRRMGHVNYKNMNRLVKGNLVRGLPPKLFKNDHTCVACCKGKQHKASYKAITAVSSISEPLQLLHMDLFGPTSIRSIDHKYYCLVITDDYSKFCWVFFLEHKDETYLILKDFINLIENQLNKKVKAIRCDNGTEFKNAHYIELYGSKGIKRDYSNARTPQQNRVAERKNRTLIEAARTMLADSKLPTMFWTEAVRTACYVLNRVLVTSPHNKTPYALLTGNIPSVSHFKPFGCHVTILNTSDHLGKFDGKADEGYIVGYSASNKAYRVYNVPNKRVEETMNLRYLEEKPNVQGLGHEWYFDLDYLTDTLGYKRDKANQSAGTQEASTNPAGTQDADSDSECDEQVIIIPSYPSHSLQEAEPKDTSSDEGDDSPHDSAIFQKEIARLKSQEQRATFVAKDTKELQKRASIKSVYSGAIQFFWCIKFLSGRGALINDEVLLPVARIEAIRLFLAFASYLGFMVYQMDVKSAFLYGRIDEEVYVTQPKGFVDPQHPKKVYKVVKALYGLHQAKELEGPWCDEFEALDKGDLEMESDMGELTFFLGLQVQQRPDGMFISQDKYVQEILKKFDLESVRTATTPYEAPKPKSKNEPDISACSRNQVAPTTSNLEVVKKIFKYLKGLHKLGLWYPRESPFRACSLFCDSEYAGANKDRKSTTGGCQFLGTLIQNQFFHQGLITIEIEATNFIRDANEKKLIQVLKIHTDDNVADLLTKAFDGPSINSHCDPQPALNLNPISKSSMAALRYRDEHNKVGYVQKPKGSDDYHQILDFLGASHIRYALTNDPIIFDSLVKQFWSTATLRSPELGPPAILATIDETPYTITEESVRSQLQLADDGGIDDLPIVEIYSGMDNLGYVTEGKLTFFKNKFSPQWRFLVHTILHCLSTKSGSWDQFGSSIAVALICLSDGRRFNWSTYIFKGMVSNIGNAKKFLMYPRFLQTILGIETSITRQYHVFKLSSKLFANMKLNFVGPSMPLLDAMLSQAQDGEGAGADVQAVPPPIPETIPETRHESDHSQDHLSTPPRQQATPSVAPVFEHGQRTDSNIASSLRVHETEDDTLGGSFHETPPSYLETKLKAHKKLFKDVVAKLVKKVKALEVKLKTKKRKVVLSDSDQEEGGEQAVDLDALIALANAAVTVDSTKSPAGASSNPTACSYDPNSDVPTTAVPTDVPSGVDPTGPSTVSPGSTIVPTSSSIPATKPIPARSGTTTATPSSPVRDARKGKGVAVEEPTPTQDKTFKQLEEERLARQMAQDFEMTEDQRKRQQEVLASAANYSDAAWDIILARLQENPDLSSTIFGVDFTDDDFAAKMVALRKVEAPSHSQNIPEVKVLLQELHRGCEVPLPLLLKHKKLTLTQEVYAHMRIPASDCETTCFLYMPLLTWEYLCLRADLMTIYGRVMTFYQDKKAEGAGLVLWGDLKILMDSPEVNDGGDF
ncbi:putative ribonuclease H-like domain-containing protein [Tanacetum coccineum]